MAESSSTPFNDSSILEVTQTSSSERRRRWFELCLVMLVAFASPVINSLYLLLMGPEVMSHISSVRWSISIVQEITSLLLVGYVLARRKIGFKDIGLGWSLRDFGIGILVLLFSSAIYAVGAAIVEAVHYFVYGNVAVGLTAQNFFSNPSLVAIPFSLLNPFFEELIVRAYLMTEVIQLTGSASLAVILSVALQFSYHLYYGWIGAISLAFLFLAFSLYYARYKRALPIIIAHEFFDISALIRLL